MIFTVGESLLPHMAVCRGQDESIAWNTTPAGVSNNKEVMKRTNSEMPTITQRNRSTPGVTHPDGINTMPAQRQNTSIADMMGPVNVGKRTIHQFADIDFASDLYEEDDEESESNDDDSNSCNSSDLSEPQRNDNKFLGNLSRILDKHDLSDDDSSCSSIQSKETSIQHLKSVEDHSNSHEDIVDLTNEEQNASINFVIEDNNDTIIGKDDKQTSIKYSCYLPPRIMFQVHLEKVIRSSTKSALNMQDDINQVLMMHLQRGLKLDDCTEILKRKKLVSFVEDAFQLYDLRHKVVHVPISGARRQAAIAVYNLESIVRHILHNKDIMKKENFAEGYDIFTGKPTSPSTHYGEMHTGLAFEQARQKYCGDDPNAFAFPLVLFYDKSHVDMSGANSASPLFAWVGWLNQKCRGAVDITSVLGYIPNLSFKRPQSSKEKPASKLQDEHNCLKFIIQQIGIVHKQGGIWLTVMGKRVLVKIWCHLIVGDTSGHNDLCCHYQSNGNTSMPMRMCKCGKDELDNTSHSCELITTEEIMNIKTKSADDIKAEFKKFSKHPIDSCFEGDYPTPFSDSIHGVYGSTPGDNLHMFASGIVRYAIDEFSNMLGPKKSNLEVKKDLDNLYILMVDDSSRNSDRDIPRSTPRDGFTCGGFQTAMENVGCFLKMLQITYTTSGRERIQPILTSCKISKKNLQMCMKQMLAFGQWMLDHNPKSEVNSADKAVSATLDLIKVVFPRTDGNGWKLPKFHLMKLVLYFIKQFGAGEQYTGQTGERLLKTLFKKYAHLTQMHPSQLVVQVAARRYEDLVLDHAFRYSVSPALGLDIDEIAVKTKNGEYLVGGYQLTSGYVDRQGRGEYSIKWKSKGRQKMNIDIHPLIVTAIQGYHHRHREVAEFAVDGFTEYHCAFDNSFFKDECIFRATNWYRGEPWYDFAMVQFTDSREPDLEDSMCPAKVLGFFQYKQGGVPTPHLIEEEACSPEEIRDKGLKDDHTYVVVHAASSYLTMMEIEDEFICDFNLGSIEACVFIMKVECLISPLHVFKDYGGHHLHHFCLLPVRKWGKYYSTYIEDVNKGMDGHV